MGIKDQTNRNCHAECMEIVRGLQQPATIRKVFNRHDPWGDKPGFFVKHPTGNYVTHYIVQIGDNILDPLLKDRELIPLRDYLRLYKNPEELDIA